MNETEIDTYKLSLLLLCLMLMLPLLADSPQLIAFDNTVLLPVRALVERHGGMLAVEQAGNTFIITMNERRLSGASQLMRQ